MSAILSAVEIAERALQRIGAYSINDSGANPVDQRRALEWLDMVVADLLGRRKLPWMVQADYVLPLTEGVTSYALPGAWTSILPEMGVQYPVSVARGTAGSNSYTSIELVNRRRWEDEDSTMPAARWPERCAPESVYVDRLEPATLYLRRAPRAGDTLRLTASVFAPDLTIDDGRVPTHLPSAWNLWAVMATAAEIGAGPIRKLPDQELAVLSQKAALHEVALAGIHSTEHAPRGYVRYWDC